MRKEVIEMSDWKKFWKMRDIKKIFRILDDEVGDKLEDVLIAVDLEELLEDIIQRVIVETITNDPEIAERIKKHIEDFIAKLDD